MHRARVPATNVVGTCRRVPSSSQRISARVQRSHIAFLLADGMVLAKASSGAAGDDMWGWAKKMPKFKIDGMDAARAETLRFALQKASSLLFKHPDLILETLAEVEAKVAKAAASNHVIDEPMFSVDKVTTFRLVPDEWIASWLQAQSGGLLTDSLLQKVLGKSHGQFERLKMFATQLPGCMAWTGGLMYNKVAARALDDRARQLGNPVSREWVEKAIAVTGDINWAHRCRSWGSLCFCSFGLKQLFWCEYPLFRALVSDAFSVFCLCSSSLPFPRSPL